MRQLGILTNIDPQQSQELLMANNRQNKTSTKFAECLQVSPQLLFDEMYPDSPHINKEKQICTHLLIPFSKRYNPLTYSISITLQLA